MFKKTNYLFHSNVNCFYKMLNNTFSSVDSGAIKTNIYFTVVPLLALGKFSESVDVLQKNGAIDNTKYINPNWDNEPIGVAVKIWKRNGYLCTNNPDPDILSALDYLLLK